MLLNNAAALYRGTQAVARVYRGTNLVWSPAPDEPDEPAFTPTDLTGLAAWYDGADPSGLWADTTGTTPATVGGGIARWDDKSGNGRHATQATAGSRPTLTANIQNGQPGPYFDGVADSLNPPIAPNSVFPGAFTILAIAKLDDTVSRTWSWLFGDTSGAPFFLGKRAGANTLHAAAQNIVASPYDSGTVTPHIGALHTYGYTAASSSTARIFLDGATVDSRTTTASQLTAGSFAIGRRAIGELWKGPICELMFYDRMLPDSERQQVEAYLRDKWATP